jgi:Fucose permease
LILPASILVEGGRVKITNRITPSRNAVLLLFFLHGVIFATWVSRIPAVKNSLGLSASALGLSLLGVAIGSIPAMPLAGWLISHHGSRLVTIVASLGFCLALPGMAFASDAVTLGLALALFGATAGAMDVAMNAHGVAVERLVGRSTMSLFHAMFSLGGMTGAAVGGLVAGNGMGPQAHFIAVCAFALLCTLLSVRGLLPASVDATPHGPAFARITRPLLGLGILAFCFLLSEGVMADWTAVYLRQSLHADPGTAASGYAFFSAAMALGRLMGDRLVDRFGSAFLVRAGSALAAAGLSIALGFHTVGSAFAGFAAVGAGFSVIVPILFGAAGRAGGGAGIAAVTTTGYFGFLAGPPVIGFVADAINLRAALGILIALSLVGVLLGGAVNAGEQRGFPAAALEDK